MGADEVTRGSTYYKPLNQPKKLRPLSFISFLSLTDQLSSDRQGLILDFSGLSCRMGRTLVPQRTQSCLPRWVHRKCKGGQVE